MALAIRARFKPDAFRSSLESLVTNLDLSTNPVKGSLVVPAQIVIYDDVEVTAQNYRPGDPAVEQFITVVYEESLTFSIDGFAAMTSAQATADFATRLDAWSTQLKPALPLLAKVVWAARRLNPRAIP